jgi:GT2 family glycosyltransferase
MNQTVKSRVLISTSTPGAFINAVAGRYGLEVCVNPDGGSSAKDWNFAYAQAETDYVTLAHQDDVYEPTFAEKTLAALESAKNPVIAYTDYYEIRHTESDDAGVRVENNKIHKIKTVMLKTIDIAKSSPWLRNRVLSFGYPICCAGATYVKRRFGEAGFITDWQNSHDWELAIRLASQPGEFLFVPEMLIGHRISLESQTTHTIGSGIRFREDFECFKRYWPEPMAKAILKQYSKSYASNKL